MKLQLYKEKKILDEKIILILSPLIVSLLVAIRLFFEINNRTFSIQEYRNAIILDFIWIILLSYLFIIVFAICFRKVKKFIDSKPLHYIASAEKEYKYSYLILLVSFAIYFSVTTNWFNLIMSPLYAAIGLILILVGLMKLYLLTRFKVGKKALIIITLAITILVWTIAITNFTTCNSIYGERSGICLFENDMCNKATHEKFSSQHCNTLQAYKHLNLSYCGENCGGWTELHIKNIDRRCNQIEDFQRMQCLYTMAQYWNESDLCDKIWLDSTLQKSCYNDLS